MKNCSKCGQIKDLAKFGKSSKSNDGFRSECKECRVIYSKKYYKVNLIDIKNKKRLLNINNPEIKKNQHIKYKETQPDKIKESNKKYRDSNDIKIKEYRIINKESLKIKKRIYVKNKMKTNSLFKLTHNIGSLIRLSIKKHGVNKKTKTSNILGCSYEELKTHIESQFQSWMTWENHGLYNGKLNYGWDVDHIIPVSSAKSEDEIIKLNHFTNLQPLCSYINRYVKRGVWRDNLSNKSS